MTVFVEVGRATLVQSELAQHLVMRRALEVQDGEVVDGVLGQPARALERLTNHVEEVRQRALAELAFEGLHIAYFEVGVLCVFLLRRPGLRAEHRYNAVLGETTVPAKR